MSSDHKTKYDIKNIMYIFYVHVKCVCVCAREHAHVCTHAHARVCMCVHVHTCMQAGMHLRTRIYMCTQCMGKHLPSTGQIINVLPLLVTVLII